MRVADSLDAVARYPAAVVGCIRAGAAVAKSHRRAAIARHPSGIQPASLWEVAIKTSLGRAGFAVDPGLLHRTLLAEGFVELPITASHLVRVAGLPWVHRDPFDRLLVAQAIEDKLTLLTADVTLKRYGRFVKLV